MSRFLATLALAAMTLSACSGDDAPEAAPADVSVEAPPPEMDPAPAASEPPPPSAAGDRVGEPGVPDPDEATPPERVVD